MIRLLDNGYYKLIETKRQTKILYLNRQSYAWVEPVYIGEILVVSHGTHRTDCILSVGEYCLYDVKDEDNLSDQQHLELEVGGNIWQGYLLPTGLPDERKRRARIIPTHELISDLPDIAETTKRSAERSLI